MSEALVDLTGGASEKFNLNDPVIEDQIKSGEFWKKLKRY